MRKCATKITPEKLLQMRLKIPLRGDRLSSLEWRTAWQSHPRGAVLRVHDLNLGALVQLKHRGGEFVVRAFNLSRPIDS